MESIRNQSNGKNEQFLSDVSTFSSRILCTEHTRTQKEFCFLTSNCIHPIERLVHVAHLRGSGGFLSKRIENLFSEIARQFKCAPSVVR